MHVFTPSRQVSVYHRPSARCAACCKSIILHAGRPNMAILTNLDALRGNNFDDMIRRVHHEKEDFVIEDQTMPVAAVIDINKYQLLTEMLQKVEGGAAVGGAEPMVQGS